jgi:hypothetical protein
MKNRGCHDQDDSIDQESKIEGLGRINGIPANSLAYIFAFLANLAILQEGGMQIDVIRHDGRPKVTCPKI